MNAIMHNVALVLVYGWAGSVVICGLMIVCAPTRRPSMVEKAEAIVRACAMRERVAR